MIRDSKFIILYCFVALLSIVSSAKLLNRIEFLHRAVTRNSKFLTYQSYVLDLSEVVLLTTCLPYVTDTFSYENYPL